MYPLLIFTLMNVVFSRSAEKMKFPTFPLIMSRADGSSFRAAARASFFLSSGSSEGAIMLMPKSCFALASNEFLTNSKIATSSLVMSSRPRTRLSPDFTSKCNSFFFAFLGRLAPIPLRHHAFFVGPRKARSRFWTSWTSFSSHSQRIRDRQPRAFTNSWLRASLSLLRGYGRPCTLRDRAKSNHARRLLCEIWERPSQGCRASLCGATGSDVPSRVPPSERSIPVRCLFHGFGPYAQIGR
jgi:hypothetical protein